MDSHVGLNDSLWLIGFSASGEDRYQQQTKTFGRS